MAIVEHCRKCGALVTAVSVLKAHRPYPASLCSFHARYDPEMRDALADSWDKEEFTECLLDDIRLRAIWEAPNFCAYDFAKEGAR